MGYIDTLGNIENLFYTIIGDHCGDAPEKILKDKLAELENNNNDFSLWSAQINDPSRKQVWGLGKNDRVFVLGKISDSAKDPGKDGKIRARFMKGPEGENMDIPEAITTTYSAKRKNYQAFVVKEYNILDTPVPFDFGKYEAKSSTNEIKSFKQRFDEFYQFQNTFGKKNNQLQETYTEKDISIIMELKYPFVVEIE